MSKTEDFWERDIAERLQVRFPATGAVKQAAFAHRLFEHQAALNPGATALIHQGNNISYGELNSRANRIAAHLRDLGVQRETLVGVCLERSVDLVASLLAVWKAGGAYVPLDPSYPAERLSFMVADAQIGTLLTGSRWSGLFAAPATHANARPANIVCLDKDWPSIARKSAENPRCSNQPADLAYVMYTSGSTGRPKGAMIEHCGLMNYLRWAIDTYCVAAGCIVPVHSSISFDLTITSLYPPLLAGGAAELLPESLGAQSLLAAMKRHRNYALVKITPAHLELLTRQIDPHEAPGMVKAFIIGGENLNAESLDLWRKHAAGVRLINEYGPTETVVGCCVHEVSPDEPGRGPVPIGRPIANTRLYVLDAALKPVAAGMQGELYIGGVGVARGYLNRPELTRERFLPDPLANAQGARMYKTGDLARCRNDGALEYLGRVDDQVKIRGHRVELGEIEAVLAEHPQVRSCVVLLRQDEDFDSRLVAYVVRTEEDQGGALFAGPAAADMKQFMLQKLPAYMVPVQLVFLDSFPLTPNGKIDRKNLPRPDHARPTLGPADGCNTSYGSETEAGIAAIWSELLDLPALGADEDLFDNGAHSLAAVQAVSRISEAFNVELQLRHVFEMPTVGGLARIVEGLLWAAQDGAAQSEKAVDQGAQTHAETREEIEL